MKESTTNNDGFKLVTNKVLKMICEKEVVLPSSYRVLFSLIAKKNDIDIGAESFHSNEEINDEVYKRAESIDNSASRAIKAIKEKDEDELQKVLEDTQKLKKEIESLKKVAYQDGLTKALNRRWLEENYFNKESETFNKDGVLVLIDLNDFKIINDTLGHAIGDKVLVSLASKLQRFEAHVIRYGGDEFALIFDNTSPKEVRDAVNVLREIHVKKTFSIMGQKVKINFGYGIAAFKKNDEFSTIIANADNLLYEDKNKLKERTA